MTDDTTGNHPPPRDAAPGRKPLTPAAERALAEAAARRAAHAAASSQPATPEHDGTQGPEPTRYGDWEHKGIASDF